MARGPHLLLLLLPLLAPAAPQVPQSDWTHCPLACRCKWVSGRKVADCSNASLTDVPANLSPEIQFLDLSYNPMGVLRNDAFKNKSIVNLQKIYLKDCSIRELQSGALSGLEILIELDLSGNHIRVLHSSTFRENVRLRILYLNKNPISKLEDGLFSNLTYLQTVEASDCHITHVGRKTFYNVPKMRNLKLNGNHLTTMKAATLKPLSSLMSLVLHSNPWNCDCNLVDLFNWTMQHNLYAQPTECSEPPSLRNRPWSELRPEDFVCSPHITWPPTGKPVVEVTGGENATLPCQVLGNPAPDVTWVFNTRPVGNHTRRAYGERRHVVMESAAANSARWVNLTVISARTIDEGDYTCIAKSLGGMEERNVTLKVHGGGGLAGVGGAMVDAWALVIGLTVGLLVLLIVSIVLCCCFCRRRNRRHCNSKKAPSDGVSSNGDISFQQIGSVSEQEKSLITQVNPVQKPPRRYEMPSVTSASNELTEMKCGLLDNGSVYVATSAVDSDAPEDRSMDSLEGPETRPPDLLSFPPRASQSSPAGSTASTAPDSSRLPSQQGPLSPVHSPGYQFGTLPYSRSQSPFATGPVVTPRQGYVTIPRRPRVPSWSSAPTPTPTGDPLSSPFKLEPVYDNLGPRTTADGSSVLSLNKVEITPASMRGRPLPSLPTFHNTLPPYYAPIEELEAATPITRGGPHRGSLPRSAPRVPLEGTSIKKRLDDRSATLPVKRSSASSIGSSALGGGNREVKVPPKPPPKPKKKNIDTVTGPLFEDEGEDGTEV